MSLLELIDVCKRGGRRAPVLDHATLQIDPGELVAVWGLRGSGRTTLLRLAAGIDRPDSGRVLFEGRDLARHAEDLLGREIGYCRRPIGAGGAGRARGGRPASEEVVVGLLVNGRSPASARTRAGEALARVGGESFSGRGLAELDAGELTRLSIAHALAMEPRLLVIDEPVSGVELYQRDEILLLLRSLADEGTAVLMSVGETTGLTGADRSLTIGDGELCASPRQELAPVVPLRRAASADPGEAPGAGERRVGGG